MGGKTWTLEEEEYFWRTIIPKSPKAPREDDRVHSWEVCAQMMEKGMGEGGIRKYTKLMLFEHYFQNVCKGHLSPRAKKFVEEHKRQLKPVRDELDIDEQRRPQRKRGRKRKRAMRAAKLTLPRIPEAAEPAF